MFNEPDKKILDEFQEYTNLSIGAYDAEQKRSCNYPHCDGSCGIDASMTKKCIHRAICELYAKRSSEYIEMPVHEQTPDPLHFAACYINPSNPDNGCYVFGPYTTSKEEYPELPYLPEIATSHIVDLLHSITKKYDLSSRDLHDVPNYHLKRIVTYLYQHYKEELTLSETADRFNLSEAYLCRLFKKETGYTYTEVLNKIRIDKSIEHLLNTNAAILDIATAVGFNSQSYFCRQFKKLVGQSPTIFRAQHYKARITSSYRR